MAFGFVFDEVCHDALLRVLDLDFGFAVVT